MGRPPCCDKVGIKKGPWTPEEDIILVSYIQEHGPGNWRAVPTNTGLLRCSKSCRLRWTNYLRPGIKRGNFTSHEEGMIIHFQALLGNKWAAIASYLPQRTDNDIKNYWNTHLKKKLKKIQSGFDPQMTSESSSYRQFMSKSFGVENTRHQTDLKTNENSSVYASSAENISRLLEGWMRSSSPVKDNTFSHFNSNSNIKKVEYSDASGSVQCYRADQVEHEALNGISGDHEEECMFSFDHNLNGMACDKSSCDSSQKGSECSGFIDHDKVHFGDDHNNMKVENNPSWSFLEKWLLDESANQVELPSIF